MRQWVYGNSSPLHYTIPSLPLPITVALTLSVAVYFSELFNPFLRVNLRAYGA